MAPDPASVPFPPTPELEEEEQTTLQVPGEPCTSEPEEAAQSEGRLDLMQGRFPSIPLGFVHSLANQTHAGLAGDIHLGAQVDLCPLGSLQVTISHDLAAGEVLYEHQSQVITQASLQLPSLNPSNHMTSLQGSRNFEQTPHSSCHPEATLPLLKSLIPRKKTEPHCELTQNGIGLQIK